MSEPITMEQIEKEYPFLQPCCDCEYWRYMDRGQYKSSCGSHFGLFRANGQKVTFKVGIPNICCHYNLDNDELKPDGAHKDDGTCECFTPYKRPFRR